MIEGTYIYLPILLRFSKNIAPVSWPTETTPTLSPQQQPCHDETRSPDAIELCSGAALADGVAPQVLLVTRDLPARGAGWELVEAFAFFVEKNGVGSKLWMTSEEYVKILSKSAWSYSLSEIPLHGHRASHSRTNICFTGKGICTRSCWYTCPPAHTLTQCRPCKLPIRK